MTRVSDLDLHRFTGRSWTNMMFIGILFVIFGVIMIACKTESVNLVIVIGGILLIIFGVIDIVSYNDITRAGLVALVAGIIMVVLAFVVGGAVILGVFIILAGIMMLCGAKRFLGFSLDTGDYRKNTVLGIVLVVIGIVIALNVADVADILMIVGGIIIAVVGVLHIIKAMDMAGKI